MAQNALTSQPHWDGTYQRDSSIPIAWRPRSYLQLIIAQAIATCMRMAHPRSILEVGCGDSMWLPWVARMSTATITGLDYSPRGCRLVEDRLAQSGRGSRVICADLFTVPAQEVGRHELVYSLGLIEHFTDLDLVLGRLRSMVAPGGTLLSVVPNLDSIHGGMTRIWQPLHNRGFRRLSLREVRESYMRMGLTDVRAWYIGAFPLDIVAWSTAPRWPRLAKALLPLIWFANAACDRILIRMKSRCGTPGLSPFFCVMGRVPPAGASPRPL
jgi:2-polyprenyl-6-hydroxyphenyl methylase/3-demethylubiquinone-9 3-methyltransferase